MNQTSPMNTATAAGAAAVLAPIVAYIASLLRLDMPAAVQSSIVVLLVAGAHWVGQFLSAKYSVPDAAPAVPPVAPAQSGFIAWPFLALLLPIALGAALLTGCTTTTASMYSGLYTQAKAGVQVFDDNSLKTMHDLLCAQPYSAIQRHPEMQAGIVTLCGPLTNTASLSAEQVSIMANMYRQLGLQPAAIALPATGAKP